MEYTVDLVTEPSPKDDHIERDGADVYVAPEAALYLLGTEMDFETTTLRTGFTFRNPNQSSACGCGELVELKPADLKALAEAAPARRRSPLSGSPVGRKCAPQSTHNPRFLCQSAIDSSG